MEKNIVNRVDYELNHRVYNGLRLLFININKNHFKANLIIRLINVVYWSIQKREPFDHVY